MRHSTQWSTVCALLSLTASAVGLYFQSQYMHHATLAMTIAAKIVKEGSAKQHAAIADASHLTAVLAVLVASILITGVGGSNREGGCLV